MPRKNEVQGFTLIELVVVFFIIGILAAVALPSLLPGCPNLAKPRVARRNLESLNLAQQAYFLQNNTYAQSLEELKNIDGVKQDAYYFAYSTQSGEKYTRTSRFCPPISGPKHSPSNIWQKTGMFFSAILCQNKSDMLPKYALNYVTPRKGTSPSKSYVGGVFPIPAKQVSPKAANDEIITITILCETKSNSSVQAPDPIYNNGNLTCAPGTREVRQ